VATGFIQLRAIPAKSAKALAKALHDIFVIFGFPLEIQSDNGREFANGLLQELERRSGITHCFSTPYYPQANGKVERSNGMVKTLLKKLNLLSCWPQALGQVQWLLNTRVHTKLGTTPYQLFFLRRPPKGQPQGDLRIYPGEWYLDYQQARKTWQRWGRLSASLRTKEYAAVNRKRRATASDLYKVGDYVYVLRADNHSGWEPPTTGPHRVLSVNSRTHTYSVTNIDRPLKQEWLLPWRGE
jgi:transposase InsO family protein